MFEDLDGFLDLPWLDRLFVVVEAVVDRERQGVGCVGKFADERESEFDPVLVGAEVKCVAYCGKQLVAGHVSSPAEA